MLTSRSKVHAEFGGGGSSVCANRPPGRPCHDGCAGGRPQRLNFSPCDGQMPPAAGGVCPFRQRSDGAERRRNRRATAERMGGRGRHPNGRCPCCCGLVNNGHPRPAPSPTAPRPRRCRCRVCGSENETVAALSVCCPHALSRAAAAGAALSLSRVSTSRQHVHTWRPHLFLASLPASRAGHGGH
eukprot:358751-Chlamydomonas_euryale.AAC.4